MSSTCTVRTMPIGELVPAPYNPRRQLKPTDKAYRKLKRSLVRFGLVEPLIWNETTGRLVSGHLRLRILKELGLAEVPVSVVALSDVEEKALNIVLNNQEAQGRYDPKQLKDVLAELRDLPEFADTGFGEGVFRLLELEPAEDLRETEGNPDRVEVQIIATAAGFERWREDLDGLVRQYDLDVHIRRG